MDPTPTIAVLRDTGVATVWDSGLGFGPVIAHHAMTEAIAKAERAGVGMVAVRNGRHFGANGYFAAMAATAGMMGIVVADTPGAGFPPGGLDKVVGTNPFAFSAPVAGGPPLVVDIAMTAVSGSRVLAASAVGEEVPEGWVVDAEGIPTTDPDVLRAGGALEPLGGQVAGHKGFGLALMVDALCILSGTGSGLWQTSALEKEPHWRQGQWFAAWRIDLFLDPAEFAEEMQRVATHLHGVRTTAGETRAVLPGERRAACRLDRLAHGVPIMDYAVAGLQLLAAETRCTFPEPLG